MGDKAVGSREPMFPNVDDESVEAVLAELRKDGWWRRSVEVHRVMGERDAAAMMLMVGALSQSMDLRVVAVLRDEIVTALTALGANERDVRAKLKERGLVQDMPRCVTEMARLVLAEQEG